MGTTIIIVLAIVALVIGGFVLMMYNALIALKQNLKKAWANIDVILKQRYDEIPQLISICEQYVTYEKSMIDNIINAREKMVKGRNKQEQIEGAKALSTGIQGLLAVGEAYPDLKANENFLNIQTRLSHLEESLADRREFYNDIVTIYNTRILQIPDVLFARMLGYSEENLFEVTDQEKQMPNLKMNI